VEGDVHANENQEGSAEKAHVGSDLENIANSLPLEDQKVTHNLKCDQDLRKMTSPGTGNKCGEADSEVGCTTHLAIRWSRNAKANEVKNYGDKKGSSRKRVDLPNGQVSPNLKTEITARKSACRNRPISSTGRDDALV
jgi:Tfp pilus assembly protein PilX